MVKRSKGATRLGDSAGGDLPAISTKVATTEPKAKLKKKRKASADGLTHSADPVVSDDGPKKKKRKVKDRSLDFADISQMMEELAPEAAAIGEDWVAGATEEDPERAQQLRVASEADAIIMESSEEERVLAGRDTRKKNRRKKEARRARLQAVEAFVAAAGATGDKEDGHSTPASAKAPRKVKEKVCKVSQGAETEAAPAKDGNRREGNKAYVSGLPWSVDEATVRGDFARFGAIESFRFKKDAKGRPLGEAYVFYKKPEDVEKALDLDGKQYRGRSIKVKRRSPRRRSGVRTRASMNHQT